jgi:hypothetical protein
LNSIKYISKPLQFNWPVSLLHDADGDGLNNHEDPHPGIRDCIAQHHASELNIPPDIVDLLEPLNSGPEIIDPFGIPPWDLLPELDKNEKDFIDVLALMDHNLQQQLVKLAAKGKITGRDLTIVDYINSLKNYGMDESYSSTLQEKVASAFRGNISSGAINTETAEQIEFLKSLPRNEQKRLIDSGLANNRDLDGDGKSNYFEKFVGNKLVYNYSVPNDWRVIIVDLSDPSFDSNTIKIVFLGYTDATSSNLEDHLSDFADKADENDIFYLTIYAHGGPSRIRLADTMVYNEEYGMWVANKAVYYSEINKWLAPVKGLKIVEINACYSGSALDEITNADLIMTLTEENTKSGGCILNNIAHLAGYDFEERLKTRDFSDGKRELEQIKARDKDGDGYFSLGEVWPYVQYQMKNPQISDPTLAKDLYFGSHRAWTPEDLERTV